MELLRPPSEMMLAVFFGPHNTKTVRQAIGHPSSAADGHFTGEKPLRYFQQIRFSVHRLTEEFLWCTIFPTPELRLKIVITETSFT